jgi:hypothetical protein
LKPSFIDGFSDLCADLGAYFSTIILAMKTFTKLFGVTQQEGESIRAYLKRFNEKMLNIEELLEPLALEDLIKGVRRHAI